MLLDLLRSAWSVQRQLAARFDGEVAGGADSFFVISGSGRPTDDDVGFAGSGRRRGRAASHGVIDNDRKFRSTDGRALGFARAGRGSERSAEFAPVDHIRCPHARA